MAWKQDLTGSGNAPLAAISIVGDVDNSVTSTGSTSQADSYLVRKPITVVTAGASASGLRLPAILTAGDTCLVANNGGETLFVYPPVGGKINAGSTNAKVDIATLKGGLFTCIDGLNFAAIVGA